MYYAINYIGRFLIPNDWVNEPYETTCAIKEEMIEQNALPEERDCSSEFCQTPSCSGSEYHKDKMTDFFISYLIFIN